MAEMDDLVHRVHAALSGAAAPPVRAGAEPSGAAATSTPGLATSAPGLATSAPGLRRSLLVVSSDHGMTSMGNHGGSSPAEVETLLLLLPSPAMPSDIAEATAGACADGTDARARAVVRQVDVAPTLALLMGVPVRPS